MPDTTLSEALKEAYASAPSDVAYCKIQQPFGIIITVPNTSLRQLFRTLKALRVQFPILKFIVTYI